MSGLSEQIAATGAGVNLNSYISGENSLANRMMVEPTFSSSLLTSATTLAVKSSASVTGLFHSITFLMPSSPTISVYDSATPSGALIARFAAGFPLGTYTFNITLSNGLSVDATSGGVAPMINFSFR
jgi:hypothetical protein